MQLALRQVLQQLLWQLLLHGWQLMLLMLRPLGLQQLWGLLLLLPLLLLGKLPCKEQPLVTLWRLMPEHC